MDAIRDAMTSNPVCCPATATLQQVAQKMIHEDTGFIPLTSGDRVCGVITDRDIVVRAVARGIDPSRAAARDFCSTDIETVAPDTSIHDAIRHMQDRQIRRLLVCEDGRPVGVVSLGDLAETVPDHAEDVLVEVSRSPKTLNHARA